MVWSTLPLFALVLLWLGPTGVAPFGIAVDTTNGCTECQSVVAELQTDWTNATTVQEILDSLEVQCKQKFRLQPFKQELCDKVAEVWVTIPPGIFSGLESLDWPIPLGVCATLGQCATPCCEEGGAPEQIHLALSTEPSHMGVSWTTLNGNTSVVEYTVVEQDSSNAAGETEKTTRTMRTNGTVAQWWLDPWPRAGWQGSLHHAVMVDLSPSTTYSYRVGDGDDLWSEFATFTTLPEASSAETTLHFAVIADMSFESVSDNVVASLTSLVNDGKIDAVIHSGDVSYADGFMQHWDTFFNKIEPIASRVPYMVTPGNHEFWYNFSAYKARFNMPGSNGMGEGGSGDSMFYKWGINAGSTAISFLACDSESMIDTANFAQFGSGQLDWMQTELANVPTDSRPWVVAHFHRPVYCSNSHQACEEGATVLQRQAEEMFVDGGVDLVLGGHVHSYERTYPMKGGNSTQHHYNCDGGCAPTYIVQGASGNREGNAGFGDTPEWSAHHNSSVGFGLMAVNRTALTWRFFAAPEEADGATLVDEFRMTRE